MENHEAYSRCGIEVRLGEIYAGNGWQCLCRKDSRRRKKRRSKSRFLLDRPYLRHSIMELYLRLFPSCVPWCFR